MKNKQELLAKLTRLRDRIDADDDLAWEALRPISYLEELIDILVSELQEEK